MNKQKPPEGVVRISLGWLVLGAGVVLIFSVLGGWLSARLWSPRPSLLTPEGGEGFIATVQEVTISPNKATGQILSEAERSVVLIGRRAGEVVAIDRSGAVVTNDGLIVTVAGDSTNNLVAFDWRGQELATEFLGTDDFFGLAYLRVTSGVLPTFDFRGEAIPLAGQLIMASRNDDTFQPRAALFETREVRLPPELSPKGVQRVIYGTGDTANIFNGSPLLDEEGKLAGLMWQAQVGLALPSNLVRESMDRVINGGRERNILTELGLDLDYTFVRMPSSGEMRFGAQVAGVAAASPAATAKINAGDVILSVGEKSLDFTESTFRSLEQERPVALTVLRGGREVSILLGP